MLKQFQYRFKHFPFVSQGQNLRYLFHSNLVRYAFLVRMEVKPFIMGQTQWQGWPHSSNFKSPNTCGSVTMKTNPVKAFCLLLK